MTGESLTKLAVDPRTRQNLPTALASGIATSHDAPYNASGAIEYGACEVFPLTTKDAISSISTNDVSCLLLIKITLALTPRSKKYDLDA